MGMAYYLRAREVQTSGRTDGWLDPNTWAAALKLQDITASS